MVHFYSYNEEPRFQRGHRGFEQLLKRSSAFLDQLKKNPALEALEATDSVEVERFFGTCRCWPRRVPGPGSIFQGT